MKTYLLLSNSLKNIYTIISIVLFSVLFSACEKDDESSVIPSPVVEKGFVAPVGLPMGQSISKTIGSAGGEIKTEDSRLTINFPEGALSGDQLISIQPLENTNPSGIGLAYRITPHDVDFQKPVSISFSYDEEILNSSLPEFLGIAYQDEAGIWQALKGMQINKATKTITVKTTHFSDWSFFQTLSIEPQTASIAPGDKLTLKVYRSLPDADLLAPLVPEGESSPIIDKVLIGAHHIEKWELGGPGNLASSGNSATYTAPENITYPTEVAISAKIKSKNNNLLLVVANIMIIPEGLTFRINGGSWMHAQVPMAGSAQGIVMVSGAPIIDNQPKGMIYVSWNAGNSSSGSLQWAAEMPQFRYVENEFVTYYHIYMVGGVPVPSPGSLNIINYGKVGEFITGTFNLETSGKQDVRLAPNNTWLGSAKIDGFFRVKRTF